jgi:hypothetical protein
MFTVVSRLLNHLILFQEVIGLDLLLSTTQMRSINSNSKVYTHVCVPNFEKLSDNMKIVGVP